MLKKLTVAFVVLVLLFNSAVLAHGAEANAVALALQAQQRMDEIDALISSAGDAARAGDLEIALRIEEEIKNYGVEIVVSNNCQDALSQLGMSDTATLADYDVEVPEDTATIHWYKVTTPGYYNYRTGGNFDLISITAERWSGSPTLLRYTSVTYKNSQHKSYTQSFVENSLDALVAYGLEKIPGMGTLLTVKDIADKAAEESRQYITAEIPTGSLVVTFSADRTIRFWYVRFSGSGTGYGLWYVEDKIKADMDCDLSVDFKQESGKEETDIVSETLLDVIIAQPTYGDMTRPCEACQKRLFTKNAVGDILVSMAGESVIIEGKYLPVDPGQLQLFD